MIREVISCQLMVRYQKQVKLECKLRKWKQQQKRILQVQELKTVSYTITVKCYAETSVNSRWTGTAADENYVKATRWLLTAFLLFSFCLEAHGCYPLFNHARNVIFQIFITGA
jgi:hypothetical protein